MSKIARKAYSCLRSHRADGVVHDSNSVEGSKISKFESTETAWIILSDIGRSFPNIVSIDDCFIDVRLPDTSDFILNSISKSAFDCSRWSERRLSRVLAHKRCTDSFQYHFGRHFRHRKQEISRRHYCSSIRPSNRIQASFVSQTYPAIDSVLR